MTTLLKNFIVPFQRKKKTPSISFFSRAQKNIVKKNKNIPANVSISVDKIIYGI